ncbi:MAG: type IX secretion system sortase PorU, partial [Bacteroidota bacterium]
FELSQTFRFDFPNLDPNTQVKVRSRVASRAIQTPSNFTVELLGTSAATNIAIDGVTGNYVQDFARIRTADISGFSTSSELNVRLTYDKPTSTSSGWLDYLELNVRRQLQMIGNQLFFRDFNSVGNGVARFELTSSNTGLTVWDVTDPVNVRKQSISQSANLLTFNTAVDELKEFVAFRDDEFPIPQFSGRVENQNLHNTPAVDMIVITHPRFAAQAEELAEFHRQEDDLTVFVTDIFSVYNEFSSGAQDITAIKDYMKMFYDRAGSDTTKIPRYLLLFGDGSYDYKDRVQGNTNFIPSFQSVNSMVSVQSYVTDDYFVLLDDSESSLVSDLVDIGVGRLPVRNVREAQNIVSKIRNYYSPASKGAWRNNIAFVADDEDANIHMRDANTLSKLVENINPAYNINKIFVDAFPQRSGAGGARYPDVNEAINQRMDLGALIMYYIGHGGEVGWGHERFLEVPDINSWDNGARLPLYVTATCEFSRFDDPQRTSAGEFVFLNPSGGGIGLLTTTRLVYSTPNKELAEAFNNVAFLPLPSGDRPRLGDITRITKLNGPKNINSRCFMLLGDPALQLAYPEFNVVTTNMPDTIRALDKVKVSGYVADAQGQVNTGFNGTIFPLIYDKAKTIVCLNNDGLAQGPFSYTEHQNVLFKGKATVQNGLFEYEFIVPKDVAFAFAEGRISYYAENGQTDANGAFQEFIIGGVSDNPVQDENGPRVELFLNNESFVTGGLTNETPDLFAKLFDETGINTSGNGIGHDLVAVLDENTAQSIVLNDYYESDIDSYQSGKVLYPMSELEEGRHTLRMKAWDVNNNSGEAITEFVVAKEADLAVDHILNYPNPFTTNTGFFFEHNQPGQPLDVRIQIFTVSGKLVKTLDGQYATSGRIGPISWDGRDEYGDKIGRGVYIYSLRVTSPTGDNVN